MSSAEYRRDEALRDTARAMSQENVEIVRSLFEASNRGDIAHGADLIDEGVVIDPGAWTWRTRISLGFISVPGAFVLSGGHGSGMD